MNTDIERRAKAHREAGRYDLATPLYEQILKQRRRRDQYSEESFRTAEILAYLYVAIGSPDKAIDLWLDLASGPKLYRGVVMARKRLLKAYLNVRDLERAQPLLEERINASARTGEFFDETIELVLELGEVYEAQGYPEKAIMLYEEASRAPMNALRRGDLMRQLAGRLSRLQGHRPMYLSSSTLDFRRTEGYGGFFIGHTWASFAPGPDSKVSCERVEPSPTAVGAWLAGAPRIDCETSESLLRWYDPIHGDGPERGGRRNESSKYMLIYQQLLYTLAGFQSALDHGDFAPIAQLSALGKFGRTVERPASTRTYSEVLLSRASCDILNSYFDTGQWPFDVNSYRLSHYPRTEDIDIRLGDIFLLSDESHVLIWWHSKRRRVFREPWHRHL